MATQRNSYKHLKGVEGYPKGSLTNFLKVYQEFPIDVFRNYDGHPQEFLEVPWRISKNILRVPLTDFSRFVRDFP